MRAILDAIWTRLAASTVYTTLGGRIYLSQGEADVILPLMVYNSAETTVENLFGGVVKHSMDIEFQIFFDNTGTAIIHTVASQLATALSTTTTATGFDRVSFVRLSSGVPSFADDSWSMTERYRAIAFDI